MEFICPVPGGICVTKKSGSSERGFGEASEEAVFEERSPLSRQGDRERPWGEDVQTSDMVCFVF